MQSPPELEIHELRRRLAELERTGSEASSTSDGHAATDSERAFRLLESITDSVAALDRDWRYIFVNKSAEQMARRSKSQLLGRVIWDTFPELKSSASYEHLHRAMDERVNTRYEEWYAPYELWLEVDAYPTSDGIVAFVRDISARKHAERRLSESAQQTLKDFSELEHYYEMAPVGLAFVDCQLRYRRVNRRLAEINGLSIEQHLGRTIRDVRPEVAEVVTPYLLQVVRTKQPILDCEIPHNQKFFRSSYYPVQSGSETLGVSIVVQDITAQKNIEIALRRSEERLQLAVEAHQIGIFDWDFETGRVVWSEQQLDLFGLDQDQFDGTRSGWIKHIVPEDLEQLNSAFQQCLQAGHPLFTAEFRIKRFNSIRWIRSHDRVLYSSGGKPYRIVGVNVDVTDERQAEEQLRRSEERYRTLFENTQDGILIVDREGRYVDVNESYCRLLKASKEQLIGAHFSDFIVPGQEKQDSEAFQALRDGASVPVDFPLRALDGSIAELAWTSSSSYLPGLHFFACRDITERKRSEEALQRSEYQLRVVLDNAPAFISYIEPDCRYVRVNRAYEEWFGLPSAEIEGLHIQDAFGKDYFEEVKTLLDKVLAGEVVTLESSVVRPNGERHEMSAVYTPDRDGAGVVHGFIALLQNITNRKRNEAALRVREAESKSLLAALPDVISRFDRNLKIVYTSPAVERLSGSPPEHFFGKTHREAGLTEALSNRLDEHIRTIFETGAAKNLEFDFESPAGLRHLIGLGMPETVTSAGVTTVLSIVRDVTEQKVAEQERNLLLAREQEAREAAELLNRVGPMRLGQLDLQTLVQSVTDIATKLIGAELGSFFHNVVKEGGEEYMLYTLSGVSREAFAGFPMPRKTAIFAPTFRGDGVLRSDDITKDPRYGKNRPYHGMPPGHVPVKSYLAAPVISRSGEVLGSLFFGHAAPARFTERHEAIITGIAAQAAIAMDNARLFEQAQWVQKELKQSNEKLRRANQDLETFAYSASHDLQEPLRNIAMSAQLLQRSMGKPFEGEQAEFFNGVLQGAVRMRTLVEDLLAYTRAFKYAEGPLPSVSASAIAAEVIQNLKSRIDQTGAKITVDDLPVVGMLDVHLGQLFQNLLGNALKYCGRTAPQIHVSATRQDVWWVFSVADNGIGIDAKYSSQIFGLFKRLHTREEYPGTGIGLAICQRIVEQYGGRIWLDRSAPGEGSVFCFSLPDRRPE